MDTSNLADLVSQSVKDFPHKPALLVQDQSVTYTQLEKMIQQWAQWLQALGIQPGHRVGILRYNDLPFVVGYFALLRLGAVVMPLNTRLTGEELSAILSDAGATWLMSSPEFEEVLQSLQVTSLQGILGEAELDLPHIDTFPFPSERDGTVLSPTPTAPYVVHPDSLAVLIYTSGTTGKPKGVMLSHENLWQDAWANVQVIEASCKDRFITISPLFHVFGQVNILLTAMMVGATVVLNKKFSPKSVLENIEKHRVTFMAAVPTMYQMMLSHLQERSYDLSSLRVCHSGAAPMAKEIFYKVEEAFGAPVQEGYGLSEASSIVTSNPLKGPRKPGSVGLPLPGITLQVMDEAMAPLAPGHVGEVHVQGKTVMQGYYQRPEETEKTLVNGWLKTKDMGYLDEEGYLFVVDRKDDLMNIGGVKVYPREIEEVLYQHPAVESAAVIGFSSALYHEEVKAFIVLHPGTSLNRQEIQKFCRAHLAEFKIPKHVEFVSEIPKGATGKILRKALRTAL